MQNEIVPKKEITTKIDKRRTDVWIRDLLLNALT
jgi:hypothetical protein